MLGDAKIIGHCWTETGVWGSAECPKLRKFGHCHNCPVFEEAGDAFLKAHAGEFKPSDSEKKVSNSSGGQSVKKASRRESSYLLFKCADYNLAFPMKFISEVADTRSIHKIPHRCFEVVSGLANINGELVVTVDILKLFGTGLSVGANFRLIVCVAGDDKFAFKADSVLGVVRIGDDQICESSATGAMAVFVEKSFKNNSQEYLLVDFELLVHAITRKYL